MVQVPVTAQAYQYIEKFGAKGARAYARRLTGLRVQTREQKALVAALWSEINRSTVKGA
jgi:hypothetical protein